MTKELFSSAKVQHFRKRNQASFENEIIGFISADREAGLSETLQLEATDVSDSMDKLPYKCNFKDKQHHLPKPSNVFHKIIPEICIVLT